MVSKFLIFFFLMTSAYAQDFVWHDGDIVRTIKLDSTRQAVVESAPSNLSSRRGEGMEFISNGGNLSMYRMVTPSGRGARSAPNRSNLPVLIDSGGMEMVPTGGIILTFKANVSSTQIQSFFGQNNLNVERTFQVKGKTNYIISSTAGLDTLSTANALKSHSIVESSSPNWWKNIKARTIPKNVDRNPKNR